jgi:hypothetical protein
MTTGISGESKPKTSRKNNKSWAECVWLNIPNKACSLDCVDAGTCFFDAPYPQKWNGLIGLHQPTC